MELLIFRKCNPPRLRGGGGWSCPDEEVLNSSHATPQARRFGTADTNSNKSLFTCFCNLCALALSLQRQERETRPPFCLGWGWRGNNICKIGKTSAVRASPNHQLAVCWLIFPVGMIQICARTSRPVFRSPRGGWTAMRRRSPVALFPFFPSVSGARVRAASSRRCGRTFSRRRRMRTASLRCESWCGWWGGRYGWSCANRCGTGTACGPCGCGCGGWVHPSGRSAGRSSPWGRRRAFLWPCRGRRPGSFLPWGILSDGWGNFGRKNLATRKSTEWSLWCWVKLRKCIRAHTDWTPVGVRGKVWGWKRGP